MTVIAFDGRTVAADKLSDNNGLARTVVKLFEVERDGVRHVLAVTGDTSHGLALVNWFKEGADPDKFPPPPSPHDGPRYAHLIVYTAGSQTVLEYQGYGVPCVFEDKFHVSGTGRELALGAMAMGATARQAVEIACQYETGCGNGVDVVELYSEAQPMGDATSAEPRSAAAANS